MRTNLWYATRDDVTGLFTTPLLVPDVNTDGSEGDAHLSNDGCRLYFDGDPNSLPYDLYVAAAQ